MKTETVMFLVKLVRSNDLCDMPATSRTHEKKSALVKFCKKRKAKMDLHLVS